MINKRSNDGTFILPSLPACLDQTIFNVRKGVIKTMMFIIARFQILKNEIIFGSCALAEQGSDGFMKHRR